MAIVDEATIRVLHVDDEPDFAELAATLLKRENDQFDIETATSATDGLSLLEDDGFDCIISDYDMPGQNGIEFLEAVRADHSDLPFVLFTGKGSEEIASDAISAGVTDYLQKSGGTDQYTVLANRVQNAAEKFITEREAEQTRQRLQAITDNSADAIITIDTESTIQFANRAVVDLFGYAPDALSGESLTTIMPERFRETHLDSFDTYLETGEKTVNWSSIEFPGLHHDGHEVPLLISYSEFWHDGDRHFIGVLRDISERKAREAEMERMREQTEFALTVTKSLIWEADLETGAVQTVAGSFEQLFGIDAESTDSGAFPFFENVIQRTEFQTVIHPEDFPIVDRKFEAIVAGEAERLHLECRTHPDLGEIRWIAANAYRQSPNGDPRLVGIATNITAQKTDR